MRSQLKFRPVLSGKHSRFNHSYAGNQFLGIVRENYGMWERRAPLTPFHVQKLIQENNIKVLIQPCTRRIFSNQEYEKAGAVVQESLDDASMIIGVKQISAKNIQSGKSYMFFSHVIKAQPANMKLLDTILERKARLFDYECITKEGRDDLPRLVAFGKYAGLAGMVDGLQGLGIRLLAEGYSNPFLNIPLSYMHDSLEKIQTSLKDAYKAIEDGAIPSNLAPLVFAFTGTGNVAVGAREIFDQLPHEYVSVSELPALRADVKAGRRSPNKLYGVVVTSADMVEHSSDPSQPHNKAHYYSHPEQYRATFHEKVLPHITCLVNGMYWDPRFPRLVTKEQVRDLRKAGNKNLRFVSDITCDIGGGVEFLERSTEIEKPYINFIPEDNMVTDDINAKGVMLLGVDILPSELPKDASNHFGNKLLPLLPPLLSSKGSSRVGDFHDLPPELHRACIASHGQLLPKWEYISRMREQHALSSKGKKVFDIELRGHLFDSGLINKVLDMVESDSDISFSIKNCNVRPNTTSGPVPSHVSLQLSGNEDKVKALVSKIDELVNHSSQAHAGASLSAQATSLASVETTAEVRVMSRKRVLLFGSGRVARPIVGLFGPQDDVHLTIASDNGKQAQDLLSEISDENRKSVRVFNFPQDNDKLEAMIRDADVVISLLPATMHAPVAEAAINQGKNFISSSYVSPAIQQLDSRAKAKGVVLLNEAGLDPGIDHMLIMKAVDSIHSRGGKVEELVSLCGGLPDPVAADNPMRYKVSWSPRGVLLAALNSARYLKDNQVIEIPGTKLLQSATPSNRFPTMRLEVVPNRDSITYRDLYSVQDVKSICRGTLRYEGWANVMFAFRVLGLISTDPYPSGVSTFASLLAHNTRSFPSISEALQAGGVSDVPSALEALHWMGLTSELPLPSSSSSPLDALCSLFEKRLVYEAGEKDMVAMYHSVQGVLPDGSRENHVSRLLLFGNPGGDSAMAATVGFTAAAAAEMALRGKLKGLSGVKIPTSPEIYNPILDRLQQFGIHWSESVQKF